MARRNLVILMIVVGLMSIVASISAEEGSWDRLGRTLFGRHNDFYDLHTGKIAQQEFDRRQRARELAWKAIPLAISPLSLHPTMGTTIKDVHDVIKSSGSYEKGKDKHGGIDLGSIQLNYLSVVDTPKFNYCSILAKTRKGRPVYHFNEAFSEALSFFLVGISLPDYKFWANLNKYEPDRIVDKDLGKTDVSKVLLQADLQLKRDMAELTHPQSELGKRYWNLLSRKSEELMPEGNFQLITMTRVWIIPAKVDVYEGENEVYILDAKLNVCTEQEYFSATAIEYKSPPLSRKQRLLQNYSEHLTKTMILPRLTEKVNYAKDYARLRKVFYSLILAQWYKQRFRYRNSIFSEIIDKGNIKDYTSKEPWSPKAIWQSYVNSLEQGEYSILEEETRQEGNDIIQMRRHYFSGGVDFTNIKISEARRIPKNRESALRVINQRLKSDGLLLFYDFIKR